MSDTVSTQIIQDGDRLCVIKFTDISDGSGEQDVVKVDVSALQPLSNSSRPCSSVRIEAIHQDISGMQVRIEWEANIHTLAWISSSGNGSIQDFTIFGGLPNNAGDGKTGNIIFTTIGANSGDTYAIILRLIKGYD